MKIVGFRMATISVFVTMLALAPIVSASPTDGTINATDRYAWSEVGTWIDFGSSRGNVHVTDSALTGYAWSAELGWISLNCSNDSSCTAVNYGVVNDGNGYLSGYAWSESAGWVNFAPSHGGVSIDSSGNFAGYAWSDEAGWISFNCTDDVSCGTVSRKVSTDWRPASSRVPGAPSGISATAGNREAAISFTPGSSGGSPIIYYLASSTPGNFTSTSAGSPITVSGLSNGLSYTFKVYAVNSLGTSSASISSNSVTLDGTAPTTDAYLSGGTYGAAISVTLTCADNTGGVGCDKTYYTTNGNTPTTGSSQYSGTAISINSNTTLEYFSTDKNGNAESPKTDVYVIDSTYPVTTITSVTSNGSATTSTSASFSFVSNKAGSTFECKLDSAAYASCASPRSLSGLGDGSHMFTVRSTDTLGHVEPSPASITWTVDTTPPKAFTLSSPADNTSLTSTLPNLVWNASSDSGSGLSHYQLYIDGALNADNINPNTTASIPAAALSFASHSWYVKAVDSAGNMTVSNTSHFSVITPSVGSSGGSSMVMLRLPDGSYGAFPPGTILGMAQSNTAAVVQAPSVLQKIINAITPSFLRPEPTPQAVIQPVTVPKSPPLSFSGKWNLLPQKQITLFALGPLPEDILAMTRSFPQLAKTFKALGVTKASDVIKLENAKFNLPNMEQVARVPSNVIFAKSGSVDYGISLNINGGKAEQIVNTIVGKTIDLAIKADKPVKGITGYVLAKNVERRSAQTTISGNSMLASVLAGVLAISHTVKDAPDIPRKLVIQQFSYNGPDKNGMYTAEIQAPQVDGEYDIVSIMQYKDIKLGTKEFHLTTVVDPEGYIYTNDSRGEIRIQDAKVSIFVEDSVSGTFKLWPAKDFQQTNPQLTGKSGVYSFLVPEGTYKISVSAGGYYDYSGDTFGVAYDVGVHQNIILKPKSWINNILNKFGL